MTNLFTNLSNLKLKYICALLVLVCAGVGNVWGTATSGTFYKITATGNLTTGYYIIAASNNANANSDYVAGSSINSNKRLEGVDINLGTSATTITNPDDALVFLITKTTVDKVDYYTFLNVKNNKYLYQSSTTRGQGMAWGDDATNFTLAGYNSSSPAGFKFTLNGASNNIFKYNASSHWFANYTGSYAVDMTPVRLYKAYKVTYNGNGNTGGSAPTDAVYYSGNGTTSVTTKTNTGSLVKTGYTFSGWNTQADGNGTDITAGNSFTITANTTLYAKWTAAASCSANPSIGTASLNGSFNMTSTTSSIGVSSGTCSTGNAACDWTDYGFVWSDGANTTTPTVGGTNCNKVQVGTTGNGTSWTGSITPSGSTTPTTWTTGHTYYVRTYGKNSKAGAAFVEGTPWSFTPYSVTFKANGGTGSDKVQYVRGGVSTTLTSNSFTKTGYTFNGWNTDADGTSGTGYTNGQSVSLSANLTLYAKWSVKTTNITLNKNNSDASGSTAGSASYTYGESTKNSYTAATRTGYTLNGYYTATSAGTKILNADGSIAGNSIVVSTVTYTDASGNWAYDNTALTLYAQWTIKNYTVTWKVNNANYTTGGPTDNVNHGSKVTKLPTAPDPASYCGSKFMGWTDATDGAYVHGTSNLYTSASQFPAAEGAQTFYAVFADYTTD